MIIVVLGGFWRGSSCAIILSRISGEIVRGQYRVIIGLRQVRLTCCAWQTEKQANTEDYFCETFRDTIAQAEAIS